MAIYRTSLQFQKRSLSFFAKSLQLSASKVINLDGSLAPNLE